MRAKPVLVVSLQDLVDKEYQRTYDAGVRLGEVVQLALRGNNILNTSVVSVPEDFGVIAALMLATNNSILLAFLSYVRGHAAQGDFNCRQAVELAGLSTYLLANPEVSFLDRTDPSKPKLLPSQAFRKKAFAWISSHEPEISGHLKIIKEGINDGFVHGDLYVAHLALDLGSIREDKTSFTGSFFDNIGVDVTKAVIFRLCKLIVLLVEVLRRTNGRSNLLEIHDGINSQILSYALDVDGYREALAREMAGD